MPAGILSIATRYRTKCLYRDLLFWWFLHSTLFPFF